MFENEKVNHVKFGEGSVMECDGSHIKIVFSCNNVEKTFAYPGAFDKFVSFQSKEAQQVAEEELTQVKLNQKKLEAHIPGKREKKRRSTQSKGQEEETII